MRVLYDDRELITELRAQVAYLRERNLTLEAAIKALQEAFAKLASVAKPRQEAPPITPETLAQQLGMPLTLVRQIDWERMGRQMPQEPTNVRR
jgi:hypothetical protein